MVWVWRACLGVFIAAYAGWLVWPLVEPLTAGGTVGGMAGVVSAEVQRLGWTLPSLWLGSAALYLIAAGLTAGGVGAAPGAFFLAFVGEVIQRLLLQSAPQTVLVDTTARLASLTAPLNLSVDPGPLSLAALMAVGLLVLMTGAWRGHRGQALTRHWTRPPVYA